MKIKKAFSALLVIGGFSVACLTNVTQATAAVFEAPTQSVLPSSSFQAPITVSDFVNASTFQFSLGWEPGTISFTSVSSPISGLLFNQTQTGAGQLGATWTAPGATPVDLSDTTLFIINFNAIGTEGSSSVLQFTDSPVPRLASQNVPPVTITFQQQDGLITIVPEPVNVALAVFGGLGLLAGAVRRIFGRRLPVPARIGG